MSLGFQRLNTRKSPPNPHITFIKPLPGSHSEVAQDFLEKISAQCVPIMRKNHIFVRSLEEYEPNREFVGRNFNAGEVIQLVLKSRPSGRWLPFEYVQMVMMHELAHCKQMNHSKAFWGVRNQYAREVEELWTKGYTGEGLWGKGQELSTGHTHRPTVQAGEVLPEHICGGTYRTSRSGRRKRKATQQLSWKEQKERRILKKFGPNGVALGADEGEKVKLEKGKKVQAKPRVAKSQRGRDLRAAAALARFEEGRKAKAAEEEVAAAAVAKQEEQDDDDVIEVIKIESDSSDYEDTDLESIPEAVDIDGSRLVDKDGLGLVKVCGDEQGDAEETSREMRELLSSFRPRALPPPPPPPKSRPEQPQRVKPEGPAAADPKPRQKTLTAMFGTDSTKKKPANKNDSEYVYRR